MSAPVSTAPAEYVAGSGFPDPQGTRWSGDDAQRPFRIALEWRHAAAGGTHISASQQMASCPTEAYWPFWM